MYIGHDEVYQIGVCPKCRQTDPSELFASDVNRIYGYLKEKGIKIMMWSDMLQPVTKYKTWRAVEKLPQDIVMLDFIWYFHMDKDIEDNLLPYGFPIDFGNLYSSHFPRFETRIQKKGIIGGQISTWVSTEEEELQKEGKFYDIYMVANMLWNKAYSHLHRPTYDRMISSMMPFVREKIKGISYPSLKERTVREPLIRQDTETFVCAQREKAYQSLIFTHTLRSQYSRLPWKAQETVGAYRLSYSDGTSEAVTIKNGREVGYCRARPWQALKNPLYRHNGYTASYECDREERLLSDGNRMTVYRYEYILSEDKCLLSVKWEQDVSAEAMQVLEIEGVL